MKVSVCSNRSILTSCELENFNYQVDTYVGCEHFCYYCYVLAQAESDWSKEIFKHNDIVARLSKEIENIPSQTIYMGYHTDPYQPCEVEHQQTRKVLDIMTPGGKYIAGASHDTILEETPVENVLAMFEVITNYKTT